jgi:hypothetical protein
VKIDDILYILRKDRNDAAHNASDEGEKALNNLHMVYELCVWYMQTYGDYRYAPTGYETPVDITVDISELEKENAELEARNQQIQLEIRQYSNNDGLAIVMNVIDDGCPEPYANLIDFMMEFGGMDIKDAGGS